MGRERDKQRRAPRYHFGVTGCECLRLSVFETWQDLHTSPVVGGWGTRLVLPNEL